MPIDASIYGQIQQPQQPNQLATLAQAYQIKGLQRQGEQADMAAQQQNKLLQLVGDPSFSQLPVDQRAAKLQGIGAFDQAGKLVTATAAANKDQRSADKDELSMSIDRYQNASGAFAEIAKDPASAPQMLTTLVQAKVITPEYAQKVLSSAAQAPDPAQFWMQGANAAISAKDKLSAQIQQQGQAVTMRGQDMSQSTALRGQDLSRQTSLETNANSVNATTRGQDLVNQRAIDAQGKGMKLTEDQGKATGWLVQAENAFKNMQAAGFDRDGKLTADAKPGLADAIASVPVVGGVGNWLRTPDRQKFVQGASSLSESLLRAATGAGVNKDEAKQKIEELTPQWGEDESTTQQKMAAIPLYIESLKVRAGPGAPKAQEIGAAAKPVGVPKRAAGITVATAEDYAKVPSGATYTTPDGKMRRKP